MFAPSGPGGLFRNDITLFSQIEDISGEDILLTNVSSDRDNALPYQVWCNDEQLQIAKDAMKNNAQVMVQGELTMRTGKGDDGDTVDLPNRTLLRLSYFLDNIAVPAK